MKSKRLAILALISASIIWGLTGPIMKQTLVHVPIFTLAFIRFGAAALLLFPFVYNKLTIKKEDLPLLILCAAFGVTFNIAFFFLGLTLTSALNTGMIISTIPIVTLIFGALFLKEKITKKLIIGGIFGLLGIGIIIGKDVLQNGLYISPIGDFIILISMFSFVIYEILSKKLFKKYHPLTITFYAFLIGSISFFPASFYEFRNVQNWMANLPLSAILGIIYGIFFSSLSAYSLWQWGLSKIDVSRAGFFFYLDPIASTLGAVLILSEKITEPFILGAILIFLGLFFAEGRLPYHLLVELKNKLQNHS
ncbi:MAG: DMT family transporter [Candidatus Levybacteria bacterium]|nr:DMT family transporter [Candidatus Levybacteria bacterium]